MNNQMADRVANIQPFFVMELLQRAKQLESQGHNIIHLEIGEPDFKTPKAILAAGTKFIQEGDIKYTQASGLPELREKIAQFYAQRYGVHVTAVRIFITPGASGALLLALSATVNAGEKLLMADPCYPCNRNFLQLLGAEAKLVPVTASSHYQLTADLVRRNWDPTVKGVLLASPANPTGTVIPALELQNIIEGVQYNGGYFFSDEIYHGLVYGQVADTALKWNDKVFVINSFSKYFGMTGWRIGWLVVPEAFASVIERLAQNVFIAASTPAQYAALAAFTTETQVELEERRAEFAQRRDFLYTALLNLGFEIPCKPEGAFYIYANCEKFTRNSFKFAYDLLESEGVAITPGKDFGEHEAERYVRFAYTTSLEKITVAVRRLENFIIRGC